ncbi:MAG: hypothetical protein JRG91_20530 [Deltaproteobacteria bacterium]|nr:hypothetical protein [Deltaproteobacteria bacterium]
MSPGPHVFRVRKVSKVRIERAIKFIRERVEVHRLELALEVGEHLFVNIFDSSVKRAREAHRYKDRSIQSIAADPRVPLDDDKLYMCLHCFLAFRVQQGLSKMAPLISAWKMGRIYGPLYDHPGMLVRTVRWVQECKVPRRILRPMLGVLHVYLASGGKLDDLLVGDKSPDTPYRRMRRILSIIPSHLGTLRPATRARSLALLDQIIVELRARRS